MQRSRGKYFSFCALNPGGTFFKNWHFGKGFWFGFLEIEIKRTKKIKIEGRLNHSLLSKYQKLQRNTSKLLILVNFCK